jgi:two-component system LytT family sensor kinase
MSPEPRLSPLSSRSSHPWHRSHPHLRYAYSVEKPATRQPDLLRTSLIAALIAIVGALLKFWYLYLDDLARERPHMFPQRALEEGTGFFALAVLIPAMVWASRKFRFGEQHWYRIAPIHLTIAIVLSFLHTSLMAISRKVLSPLLGMGPYDYGEMRWRYPMEFSNFIFLYAMFVAALTLFDYYRELRRRQVAGAEMERRLAQAQFQNLQLQLQPHFLFNALNTISSVMYEDVKRADAMLAQLSDLLRRTLRRPGAQQVPLEEEIEMVRTYLRIMQERFGDDLRVEIAVDPDVAQVLVPQLLLQPLVENSIRHAAGTSPLQVTVRATRSEGDLLLCVSDNGPGMRRTPLEKGIGLTNTAERLAALYGERHKLSFGNEPSGGLTVTVQVPMRFAGASV